MVEHDDAVPGVEIRVKGPLPRRQPSPDAQAAPSAAQRQEPEPPTALQPQPSGAGTEAGTEAEGAPVGAGRQPMLARGSSVSHLPTSQQELLDVQLEGTALAGQSGSATPGHFSALQPLWQQPGMPAGAPLPMPVGPASLQAGPPWQNGMSWGPPGWPMPHPLAPPGWAYPAPFQQPMQQLPSLASMAAPPYLAHPPAHMPWGLPLPQANGAAWTSGPARQLPLHLTLQQYGQQHDPHELSSAAGQAPYTAQPLPQGPPVGQQHEQPHMPALAFAGAAAAQPPAPMFVGPAGNGVPVWETRSVLSMRDSMQGSR